MTTSLETFEVRTAGQWRAWLEKHHARMRGVWLVFHKAHTGQASIAYADSAGVTAVSSPGPKLNSRLLYGEDRRDRVTLR